MENLLNKLTAAGLDPSSVSGNEAISMWNKANKDIATTPMEHAQCLSIIAEYYFLLHRYQQGQQALVEAQKPLHLPEDAELLLNIKYRLSEYYIEHSQYKPALQEYIEIAQIAVEYGCVDEYASAVLGMAYLCASYGEYRRASSYLKKIANIAPSLTNRSICMKYNLVKLICAIYTDQLSVAHEAIQECEELSILVSDKFFTGILLLYEAKVLRLNKEYLKALHKLASVQHSSGGHRDHWLARIIRCEMAYCLLYINKKDLSSLLLSQCEKDSCQLMPAPATWQRQYYTTSSEIYAMLGQYQQALKFEKKGFDIESYIISQIPMHELGATQLRRLARSELKIKLILSEQENRLLKETTEANQNTMKRLQHDAFTDTLSSLPNRRWMDVKLKDLQNSETGFFFLVIDIDHFKSINDELSHLTGDQAIITVAHELSRYFSFHGASCVRFGGEEFLVIIENSDYAQVQRHAENYRQIIEQYNWSPILEQRQLTISIGITHHREGENIQRTFHRADKALYRAKANGRNQVCIEK